MTHARTLAISLSGLEGTMVEVEADVTAGLPAFTVVGLPDSSTLQSRDRVRAAAAGLGMSLVQRRITVNLQPAWRHKHGSGFDLPIAVAVLAAQGGIAPDGPATVLHLGELGLDGRLRPIPGVLPALLAAREHGVDRAVVPIENMDEARLVDGIDVMGAANLAEVLLQWGADVSLPHDAMQPVIPSPGDEPEHSPPAERIDFADVLGQRDARHAAEIAAAGGHHLLMTGPPGAGKSLIASRLPTILPPLNEHEALEVSAIASLTGRFRADDGLIRTPPFERPHHTASTAAIVGGGAGTARPGAISRAHAGVLFLDEAPEFAPGVLDALREPLETGDVTLHRIRGAVRYPARFQLVMAANPCPCGHAWGNGERCTCTPLQRRRYMARLSGPILDRIDMRITVGPVDLRSADPEDSEPSALIAERVRAARARQAERYAGRSFTTNAHIPAPLLRGELAPRPHDRRLLEHAIATGRLTLRGHDRVLRTAWTLADLDGTDHPDASHIGRALTLRGGDL